MPGLDRTGPEGQGAQTGRKKGKCQSNSAVQDSFGRGRCNRGKGRKNGSGRAGRLL
ncbi:DUF5320 domain-containing protein [bacterium]|nr:DUF5320 domain-containing protein [bacterium]